MLSSKWIHPTGVSKKTVAELAQAININPYLSAILVDRGITTFDQSKVFFRPSLDRLHDPFLMKDMGKAVERLNQALFSKEKVLIYGDYDVDGTTSVALLYQFLKDHGHDTVSYYVPDRYDEGYGISEVGVRWAAEHNYTLMIALDCGIKAYSNAVLAKSLGIDLIVCDHHLPGDSLPDAYAILDPKRKDCRYPFDGLSGCGVGFKLLQAFCIQNTINERELYEYLDLVAVSIASDLVDIIDENRTLCYYGLKKLNSSPSIGLSALIEIGGLKNRDIDIQGIVFGIGPRINAAGRIDHAKSAVKLLVAENKVEAKALASQINKNNTRRKDYDKDITKEAIQAIESGSQEKRSTVLFDKNWHKGVIGIVASRCIEKYYRPTIIMTESNGKATGSARSVEGFDIYEAIATCSDLLDQYGGHQFAAGVTLPLENVKPFTNKFEEVVAGTIKEESLTPQLLIDAELPLSVINFKFYQILGQMGPFGPGNHEPIFASKNLVLVGKPRLLKDTHLKFYVRQQDGKQSHEVVAFNLGSYENELKEAETFSLAYHLQYTTYMGEKSLQLNVKDIRFD